MFARSLALGMALLAAVPLCAQQAPNRVDEKGRKQGEWARHWETTGALRYEGTFRDDKPVGIFRHYDEQGRPSSIVSHRPDGRTSYAEHLHPNGRPMAAGKYVGQVKDSVWTYYTPEGAVKQVEHYNVGRLHGERLTYHPNGQLAERTHFKGGRREGAHETWYGTGNKHVEATYVADQLDGRYTLYHPNGRKEAEGQYVKGRKEGTWVHFLADGKPHVTRVHKEGRLTTERRDNGTFTEFWDGERVRSETTWKNGKREGPFTEYHNNGQWVLRKVPADPVTGAPAFEERVLQGQTKAREGTYVNDLLEGEVREYDDKGKLVRKRTFVAGQEK
jgi:antitoxin component YwqK of YwqJK toxin-antitoxin module